MAKRNVFWHSHYHVIITAIFLHCSFFVSPRQNLTWTDRIQRVSKRQSSPQCSVVWQTYRGRCHGSHQKTWRVMCPNYQWVCVFSQCNDKMMALWKGDSRTRTQMTVLTWDDQSMHVTVLCFDQCSSKNTRFNLSISPSARPLQEEWEVWRQCNVLYNAIRLLRAMKI